MPTGRNVGAYFKEGRYSFGWEGRWKRCLAETARVEDADIEAVYMDRF